MAALRQVASTGVSSATMDEARHRALSFFKDVCRSLPSIMDRYYLHEVITLDELRAKVAQEWRKHQSVQNPKVVDMLVYKGQEEHDNVTSQSKQRHHIISRWVVGVGDASTRIGQLQHRAGILQTEGESDFLRRFYEGNDSK